MCHNGMCVYDLLTPQLPNTYCTYMLPHFVLFKMIQIIQIKSPELDHKQGFDLNRFHQNQNAYKAIKVGSINGHNNVHNNIINKTKRPGI